MGETHLPALRLGELAEARDRLAAIEVELMGSEEYGQGWPSAKISRFPEDFTLLLTDDRPRHANPTSQSLGPVDRQFVRAQCFEEVS